MFKVPVQCKVKALSKVAGQEPQLHSQALCMTRDFCSWDCPCDAMTGSFNRCCLEMCWDLALCSPVVIVSMIRYLIRCIVR